MLRIVLADTDRVPRSGTAIGVAELDADIQHSCGIRATCTCGVQLAARGRRAAEAGVVLALGVGTVEESILVVVDAVVADLDAEVHARALAPFRFEDRFRTRAIDTVAPALAEICGAVGREGAARAVVGVRDAGATAVAERTDVALAVVHAAFGLGRKGDRTPAGFLVAGTLVTLGRGRARVGGRCSADACAIVAVVSHRTGVRVIAADTHAVQVETVDVSVAVVVEPVGAVLGAVRREVSDTREIHHGDATHIVVARGRIRELFADPVCHHARGDGGIRGSDRGDGALGAGVASDAERLLDAGRPTSRGRVGHAIRRVGVPVAHAGGEDEEDDCREESRGELDRSVGDQPFPGIARHEL